MRIVSGIRPSGKLHIGNYLGALREWVKLQEKHECLFFIADLHAITTPFEPKEIQKEILETLICYLAAGLDPEKSIIFLQSKVKEHTELAWILGTICPLGELKRMTQFKEKSKQHKDYVNAGLLNYPLLMAADILLYQADLVPVGKDQTQHLELVRELARRFNKMFGETFKIPKAQISEGSKIMSLTNPKKKMSKTDEEKGCIFLFDSEEEIKAKIMSAVTDSGKEIKYDPKKKPGISNLILIYSLFSGKEIKNIENEFKGKGYAFFKRKLAQLLIDSLKVFRKKRAELSKREIYLKEILKKGTEKAQRIAQKTMEIVKKRIGFFIEESQFE